MKKIGIIIPTLNGGGAERVASNLSKDLSENYEIVLIVFDNSNQAYPSYSRVIDLGLPSRKKILSRIFNLLKRKNKIHKIKKSEKFDCVISLLNSPNYINVKTKCDEKVIISIRNNMSLSNCSKYELKRLMYSCKKADYIISLSETIKNDLIKNFNVDTNKIFTIYNSCDGNELISLSDNSFNYEKYGEYIVTMGRIHPQKGHWHLIKAFSLVHKKYPNLNLVILGTGNIDFINKIIEISKKFDVEKNVFFEGYIKNPHIIIKNSKLFVFSSLYEGLGNVLLEALACGKAIVSTDCMAGPREILAPNSDFDVSVNSKLKSIEYAEYGVLTPSFKNVIDIENFEIIEEERYLADAIIELLSNTSIIDCYEKKSSKRIEDFSSKHILEKWVDIIEK